jgi:hypothetical protein
MTDGRTPPELPTFTFKDTGVTVHLRKLSPFMADQIGKALRKEKPAPTPPLNTVDYGDGKTTKEPNPADPAYQQALADYEAWIAGEAGQRLIQIVLDYAVEVGEIDTAHVASVRAIMAAIGAPVEDDDRTVYLKYIAVGSQDDLDDLLTAATRRSQPTEAAIVDNVTAFPGNVSS